MSTSCWKEFDACGLMIDDFKSSIIRSASINHSAVRSQPRRVAGDWRTPGSNSWPTCPEEVSLRDLASNAALRRSHHDHRLAVVAHSRDELTEHLAAFVAGQPVPGASSDRVTAGQRPRLAFVCSGQGPQWWAMGRQLLEQEPVFRAMIQRCDEIVRRFGPWSLLEELTADEGHSRMAVTAISQPAIFALQVALAALWRSWGVQPEAVIGHSVGEVAAAHLAGVFSLEDAMRVIYQRGRCMELAPARGRMLAVGIAPEEARRLVAALRRSGQPRRCQRSSFPSPSPARRRPWRRSPACWSNGKYSAASCRSITPSTAPRWTRFATSCWRRWTASSRGQRRCRWFLPSSDAASTARSWDPSTGGGMSARRYSSPRASIDSSRWGLIPSWN